MICVIADDLSGAAELGGVALRYGLTVEVQLELDASARADLICASTDTRSCTADDAAARAAHAADLCLTAGFTPVFKKVDSVLRGWVAVELAALMRGLAKPRTLLVPANPSLGRTIRGGRYLIAGRPLHETDFALDPEHPLMSSEVLALPGLQPAGPDLAHFPPVHLLPAGSRLPPAGILVGETASPADVAAWAESLDDSTLPAGAAEFFAALLARKGFKLEGQSPAVGQPRGAACGVLKEAPLLPLPRSTAPLAVKRCSPGVGADPMLSALFVCGSTSDASRSFLRACEERGLPVLRMPLGLFEGHSPDTELLAQWAAAVVRALDSSSWAVVAIGRPLRRDAKMPQRLGNCLSAVVQRVLEQRAVEGIFVEGGATATALVRALGWKRLTVLRELGPGAVSMRPLADASPLRSTASEAVLTIKPGSYAWPPEVWRLCPASASRKV